MLDFIPQSYIQGKENKICALRLYFSLNAKLTHPFCNITAKEDWEYYAMVDFLFFFVDDLSPDACLSTSETALAF